MELLLKQAVTGDTGAQYHLALNYLTGQQGPFSLAEGMRWLESAARAHHADAIQVHGDLSHVILSTINASASAQGRLRSLDS